MKNIFKIFLLLTLVFAVGCENEDDPRFQPNSEFGWIEFQSAATTLAVNSSVTTIPVTVNFTAPINLSAVTVSYTVEDVLGNSSLVVGASGTLVILPETRTAQIELTVLSTAAAELAAGDVSFDVVLNSSSRGIAIGVDGSTTAHRVNLVCDIALPLGGMYSVFTTYGYHDFLPSFSDNTENMEIVDNGDGTFFTQDFSGGLYNGGPYSGAYGTGATSFDFTFSNACTAIVWTNQNDPWGSVDPLDGGVNEYDLGTGVMTTSWFCNGYGENGVSVWTPL
tara:strand:+ start:3978 stop:4814 length:837 start_codon:yes stop_codon:yes gene_type:complete